MQRGILNSVKECDRISLERFHGKVERQKVCVFEELKPPLQLLLACSTRLRIEVYLSRHSSTDTVDPEIIQDFKN